mmetsp:Transcript_4628/g.8659  ORF Transcript_4628/g.8659 Transcript_4628/m.8659 type:complete len:290 (+) Transcript_4628:281-1150(+)
MVRLTPVVVHLEPGEKVFPGLLLQLFACLPAHRNRCVVLPRPVFVHFIALGPVGLCHQPVKHHLALHLARIARDGGAAGPVQRLQEGALRSDGDARVLVVQARQVPELALVPRAAGNADGPLRHRGQHLLDGENLGDVLRQLQAAQPGVRQQGGVHHALAQLADAALHVAAEVHNLQSGVHRQQLRLATQRRRAHGGVVRKIFNTFVLGGNERVAYILAGQVAGEHSALRKVGRHVFHRMHGNVNATVQQRIIYLLGEETLPSNVSQRLVENFVTSGLNNHYLQCTLFS